MENLYFDSQDTSKDVIAELAKEKFGDLGGYAQQYLFYYGKTIKLGVQKSRKSKKNINYRKLLYILKKSSMMILSYLSFNSKISYQNTFQIIRLEKSCYKKIPEDFCTVCVCCAIGVDFCT